MTASNKPGLGLFDDAASAVGNFPSALRGYDRSAVDDYVRALEAAMVKARRHGEGLEQQVGTLSEQLADATEKLREAEVNYTTLGGRASDILRLAEEQAREVTDNASVDAERVKEEARREADQLRDDATRAGNELRTNGLAEIERLRVGGQTDIRLQVEKAEADAATVVAAARRQAEALQLAAENEAQTLRQNAYLDTEQLRRTVEREVAEIRQEVASERELAIGHLKTVHDEAVTKTSALLAEATDHHRQSSERLAADLAEAARIRSEALAESERLRMDAITEAEERVAAARKQAAAITERTQQEFAWRKQQLRRDTDLLGQRKQAVLNQLASLSALAEQTAHAFPDLEDLEGFDGEHGEHGDQTVMMPASALPALPKPEEPRESQPASASAPPEGDADDETRVLEPVGDASPTGAPPSGANDDTMEIDGDATIMVPASQLPAGTAHLHGGSSSQSR